MFCTSTARDTVDRILRPQLRLVYATPPQDQSGNPIAGPEFSAELAAELDQYGAAVGAPGQWASCVRLVDPAGATLEKTGGQGRLAAATNLCLHSSYALLAIVVPHLCA
jgi:hypothetical protein